MLVDDTGGFHGCHRVLERLAVPAATPGVAGDPNVEALLLQSENLIEAQYGVGNVSISVDIEKFAREELRAPIDSGHPLTVIGGGANGSRHVRAMSIIILSPGHARSVQARETVGAISRVHPQIALQIRVRVIDPRVDDGYDDIARAGLSVPGLRCGNLRHVPLLRPEWIRWRRRIDMNHIVGFGVQHGVVSAITGDGSN